MTTSNSMHMPDSSKDAGRSIGSPELIERLAREMQAREGADLPHAFYVEQIRRQLSGEPPINVTNKPSDMNATTPAATSSVFQCWAMPEHDDYRNRKANR